MITLLIIFFCFCILSCRFSSESSNKSLVLEQMQIYVHHIIKTIQMIIVLYILNALNSLNIIVKITSLHLLFFMFVNLIQFKTVQMINFKLLQKIHFLLYKHYNIIKQYFYMATSRNLYLFALIFIAFAFLAVELEQSLIILRKVHTTLNSQTCSPSCDTGKICSCKCTSPCKKGVTCIAVCVFKCTCS